MHILHSSFYRCRVVENNWILCRKVKSPSCSDQSDLNAPDVVITTRLLVSTNVRGGLERSISQGGNGGGHAHARFICSLDAEGCVSPLCSDCCARLLRDWPPVSAFGRERGSRQHPLLVEHSRPNCRVIRAFESPNTTKVSKNTSKSRWICRFWQKKKVARRMICLVIISAWSGEKGGGTLFALANHYIFTVKNKTWRYCCYNNLLLFIY